MKALAFFLLTIFCWSALAQEPDDSKLRADLQAATNLACAKDAAGETIDPAVCQCNTYLLNKGLPNLKTLNEGVAGPISFAEKARIIRRTGVVGKQKEELNMACAAAWMSIKNDVIEIGVMLKALAK